jgi:hypothetical protein
MTSDPGLDSTRRFAAAEIKRLLGIAEPTSDRLFAKARTVIGQDRANRCLDLARQALLTRRWVPASAIASLVVGTQDLGPEWWGRNHEELAESRLWVQKGIPDRLLTAGHGDPDTEDGGSCLDLLGQWVSDDAADRAWGRPVDRVDVDDPRVDGRVGLPKDARAGDRLTAIFAPGGRVWVDVVDRNAEAGAAEPAMTPHHTRPARLGTRLSQRTVHDVAQIRSAWTMATSAAPIRLPGEMAGRANDPYAASIEADVSRRLYDWARAQGIGAQQLAGPWRTKDGLWSARLRLGLIYGLPGAWLAFDDAVIATIDDDRAALREALAALGI